MFEYKFVRIDASMGLLGGKVSADYREIVQQHATEGWRLAHVLGPGTLPIKPGTTAAFELIFERPKDGP
jgi:hypothetical protein